VASLAPSFGRGAMTNGWTDIKNTDLVIIMGGNAAEAHPCGFKWVTEAKHHRKARLIVVDPRFTRSAAAADIYCPLRAGTDIAFLGGVIKYLLDNDKIQREYVVNYTNAGFIVGEGYGFADGLFTGYNAETRNYDTATWNYELEEPDANGNRYAKVDETLQHPRCVFQLMKQHYARYTPEMVEQICGSPKDRFLQICQMIAETSAPAKAMTVLYALGWTQHSKGSQNIRTMAMIQLLLGNIGLAGGGMNALRGHSNIQGLTDLGLMSNLIPGYLTLPNDREADFDSYIRARTAGFRPLRPGQTSFFQNYPKFFVSFLKSMYGDAAKPENKFGYEWLPKLDVTYDVLRAFERMHNGQMNGYICQGFNPLMSFPNKSKITAALAKLKFLVVMDPLQTETARFWENHGAFNNSDPSRIQTEVFELPTTCFAEDEGSLTNSSRVLQWHWPGAEPPGEARIDIDIMADLFLRLKTKYQREGGKFTDPMMNLRWPYLVTTHPKPEEILREINGHAIEDLRNAQGAVTRAAGQLVAGFGELTDDGKTSCGCWIYSGSFTEAGNMTARRNTADPSGLGVFQQWAWSWPANRRILYNRASADKDGKPWDPTRRLIEWNGRTWTGVDVPDFPPGSNPSAKNGPFIMNAEGVSRLWVRGLMRDGPFPEHYEPFESPVQNALHPAVGPNPVARVFRGDLEVFGKPEDFPIVATTYRLTEHFHFWSKHVQINAMLQPELFVEISEQLAREKNIRAGDWIKVRSNRGEVRAKAVVTKRMPSFRMGNRTVHQVGIPIHWGFTGATRKGFGANILTPYVGDANIETPEYKAFLVDVVKDTVTA
jgi:formate dehydrogenase major subunit